MAPRSTKHERITLKARYVFPVTSAPIPDGTVTIEGTRIVGLRGAAQGTVRDLGNVAILPGLVNAHTHLEFSDLRAPLGPPGMGFVQWIEAVIRFRREAAERPPNAVELGLRESSRSGVTALGEIAQPGFDHKAFRASRLDATVFVELIAPTRDRINDALNAAALHEMLRGLRRVYRSGLAPHAPYSVHPELLRDLLLVKLTHQAPIAFHLAESREELELLRLGTGPFREFLSRIEGWSPAMIPRGTRPLDYLRLLSKAKRALVIHGNYLDEEETALVAEQSDRMAVVYCPRTHAYFGHDPYPLARYLSAGVVVGLGTDSRASSPDLSILSEMRFVARHYPAVSPRQVIRLGTLDAARVLGLEKSIGSLSARKYADLAIVRLPDRDAKDPHELLFDSDEPVVGTWYRGERVNSEF